MRAYSDTYATDAQRRLGSMLDFAVNGCAQDLSGFYERFLRSGLAERFGRGEPAVVAGCSGVELALQVLGEQGMGVEGPTMADLAERARSFTPIGGATSEYWTGWSLAYYQWESGRSLLDIDRHVGVAQVRELYHPFHEMDITQFCDQMDAMCAQAQPDSALKAHRVAAGLSQSQLARAAGISVRTLQQYEQRRKDINKAQVECMIKLARALHCHIEDLLEYSSQPHYEYAVVSI